MPLLSGVLGSAAAGTVVSAFKQSSFTSFPQSSTSAGSPDGGPVTADSNGVWSLTVPTSEPYYLRFVFGGATAWEAVFAYPSASARATPTPDVNGLLAWAYDPAMVAATSSIASGTVFLTRVQTPSLPLVTNFVIWIATAGSSLTAGANWLGLYDANGNRLSATSADAFFAQNAVSSLAIAGGPIQITTPSVIVAILAVGTTPPLLGRANSIAGHVNTTTAVASLRAAQAATGQIALPASLTASPTTGFMLWAGLS